MNANHNASLDDDSRFDGLVDGALSTAEYQALLSSLEDEPGGWRRCALAFLEAQAWRKEFAAIRRVEDDGAPRAKTDQPVELPEGKRGALGSFSPLLAAAACALLAFGLGLVTRNSFDPAQRLPTRTAGQTPWTGAERPPRSATETAPRQEPEIAAMEFVLAGDGDEVVFVPVIEGETPGSETLVETEPAIPDSVLRSLRLKGHDIRRQQEFIPVATGDGRHVIFPVEQYRINPVSSRSY